MYDLKFAYGFPVLAFIMFAVNRRLSRKSRFNPLLLRISLAFCLLLFVVVLSTLIYQDREAAAYLWSTASLPELLLYIALGLATLLLPIALVYWKLRPNRWKSDWN